MIATASPFDLTDGEQSLVLAGVRWEQFVAINDAFPDRSGLRMIFIDGTLTLLTPSRRHQWYANILNFIVNTVALRTGLEWEIAGSATFRKQELHVGVEGGKTYYFGVHAEIMRGPVEIDLSTQPPPDLAIEVEVSHPADNAIAVYARLGVPEVWQFDLNKQTLIFWVLCEDQTYQRVDRSQGLPMLVPEDALEQVALALKIGPTSRWLEQLEYWVMTTLIPRKGE